MSPIKARAKQVCQSLIVDPGSCVCVPAEIGYCAKSDLSHYPKSPTNPIVPFTLYSKYPPSTLEIEIRGVDVRPARAGRGPVSTGKSIIFAVLLVLSVITAGGVGEEQSATERYSNTSFSTLLFVCGSLRMLYIEKLLARTSTVLTISGRIADRNRTMHRNAPWHLSCDHRELALCRSAFGFLP